MCAELSRRRRASISSVQEEDGSSRFQLHAKDLKVELDREALRRTFVADEEKIIPLGFFVRGYEYKLLWLLPTDVHFFGPVKPRDRVYFWGADRLGRDILSRIIIGTRISMSVGLVGVAISLVIGVSLGGLFGLLRRLDRQSDPAPGGVHPLDPDHTALDGSGRCDPARLATATHLFRRHHHRLDDRLDQPSP